MNEQLFTPHSVWIWLKNAPDCNCYGQFRKIFCTEDMKHSTKVHISAEGQYTLFLNGTYVPSGQYTDFPEYKSVQTPDITPLLHTGENLLEIRVWYPGTDTSVSRREIPGLRFEVRQERNLQEETVLCYSDTTCETRLLAGYVQGPLENITPQLGMTFCYRTSESQIWENAVLSKKEALPVTRPVRELSVGKTAHARIKSQGMFRLETGANAGERLQQAGLYYRDLSSMSGTENRTLPDPDGLHLKTDSGDGIFLLLDLGCMTSGYLVLDITTPVSAPIDIGFGEHLEDLRVRTSVGGRCLAVSACSSSKRHRFVHYFRRLGCRYLQLFLYCREATVYEAGILPVTYPVDETPTFRCSDSLHNKIYEIAKRTLHLCMHEHYEDCPWREQALYAFDSRNQMLAGYYAFGEYTYPRENLRLLALSQRENGLLELCAPARLEITIPSFSLTFIVALEEYCRYSGDLNFGREMLHTAQAILNNFSSRIHEGLTWCYQDTGYWNFYEWNPLLDGIPIHRSETLPPSADAGLQLFGLLAFQRMVLLHHYLGLPADTLEQKCRMLTEGLEQFWDEQAGAYASFLREGEKLQFAELIQALALYTDACPAHRRAVLRQGLMKGHWLPVTLSYSIFKYEALLQEPERYTEPVFGQIAERWGHMLFSGATAFWETDLGAEDFEGAGSLCHGWSGIPVYLYGRYLAGIGPKSPGIWNQDSRIQSSLQVISAKLRSPKGVIEIGASSGMPK